MYPAKSLIAFTLLSGLGLGLMAWLALDPSPPTGWAALLFHAVAFALALAGLGASSLHLGRPERALKAFSQWRSSWLSREAWLAVLALSVNGLHAAVLILAGQRVMLLGWLAATLALLTVLATSMIYAQLKTVPRWHHWTTPALFLLYAITGGALLAGEVRAALILLPLLALGQGAAWAWGDRRVRQGTTTLDTATGLNGARALLPPHTGQTYLTREMAFVVARRHARKLRALALILLAGVPVLALLLPFHHVFALVAVASHVAGGCTARWLFFAEAEHVQALYYGRTPGRD